MNTLQHLLVPFFLSSFSIVVNDSHDSWLINNNPVDFSTKTNDTQTSFPSSQQKGNYRYMKY